MCTHLPIEIILSGGKIISTIVFQYSSSADYAHPLQYIINKLDSFENILGIKIHNDKSYTLLYGHSINEEKIEEISEGDLLDKFISIYENLIGDKIPEERIKEFENTILSATKEISKEEYYNLK